MFTSFRKCISPMLVLAVPLIAIPLDTFAADYPVVKMSVTLDTGGKKHKEFNHKKYGKHANSHQPIDTNYCLSAKQRGKNKKGVYLNSCSANNDTQHWYEIDRGNGYYSYQQLDTDYCLDGKKSGNQRKKVNLSYCDDNNNSQYWLKVDMGDEHYRLENLDIEGFSLDANNQKSKKKRVDLLTSNDNNQNQHWSLTKVRSAGATFVGAGGTVAGALPVNCDTPEGFTVVNSLGGMIETMSTSNAKVALAPGNYTIDETSASLFTSQTLPGGKGANTLFTVNGNNSHYDFRCASIEFDTDLWRQFTTNQVIQLRTVGNYNTISNLTIEDIGETSPKGTALGVMMDGRDNIIEGAILTSRGSQPYGLGDAYGKGGGPILSHQKHSSVLIRGLRNTFKQSTVFNYSYGHSVFMQGSEDTLIDGIYVQGELRSTADMLAGNDSRFSAADARAAAVGYNTVWGYKLPTGYWMSLQEAGIRAYNAGRTVIDGIEYGSRAANNVTVLNSVIRNTRTGVTLAHAKGTKYVENTTVLGCETGYSIGSGNIVDSYADADIGPALSFAYSSDSGTTADITILPTDGAKNGWGAVAFIGGKNHNITLRSNESTVNQNLKVVVSGDKNSIRHLENSLQNQDQLTLSNTVINNLTSFPMVINELAQGVSGQSDGLISGNVNNNDVQQN